MKLSDFDYNLPGSLIATHPVNPRDHSRLLVLDKETGDMEHKKFFDIIDYLNEGDVLVLNNSKVIPARLIGKKESGGKVEVFLHKRIDDARWECMIGGRKIKENTEVYFDKSLIAKVLKNNEDGTWEVGFNITGQELEEIVEEIGEVPLPPYIKQDAKQNNNKINYQTVYADDERRGSVAAPTAGLHFTPELLQKIKDKGVHVEYITLHVGLGTFAPVKVDNIKEHKMHSEFIEIDFETADRINKAKQEKRKIITIGTTSTRTLEYLFGNLDFKNYLKISCTRLAGEKLKIKNFNTWVDIFIYPGYEFKIVDAMITNFHLPKSTLIMLVSALAGEKNIKNTYKEAIKEKYRFYSYGDAMFIK